MQYLVMPGLYSKLVETKRVTISETNIQSQKDIFSMQPDSYPTQHNLKKLHSTSGEQKNLIRGEQKMHSTLGEQMMALRS